MTRGEAARPATTLGCAMLARLSLAMPTYGEKKAVQTQKVGFPCLVQFRSSNSNHFPMGPCYGPLWLWWSLFYGPLFVYGT